MKAKNFQSSVVRILEKVGIPQTQINPKARLVQDLGFDSIELTALVMDLERELRIEIDDSEFFQLATMGNLIDYLDNKVAHKKIN